MKKTLVPYEYQESEKLVSWCKWNKVPIIHIPNEGKRIGSLTRKGILEKQGVFKGVCDFFIPCIRNGKGGLWIELKRNTKYSKPTPYQLEFINMMQLQGYCAIWCKGADKAIQIVGDYLNGRHENIQ